jgi:hypothetical protein
MYLEVRDHLVVPCPPEPLDLLSLLQDQAVQVDQYRQEFLEDQGNLVRLVFQADQEDPLLLSLLDLLGLHHFRDDHLVQESQSVQVDQRDPVDLVARDAVFFARFVLFSILL